MCLIVPIIGEVELSEVTKLKIENLKLKTQVAQLQSNIASCTLTVEQAKLLEVLRKELDAKETDTFDWNNLSFNSDKK